MQTVTRKLHLNPSRWIILAEIAPPPNIRVGSERVLAPNVRWGRGASALRTIHLLGLRVKLNFNIPMDSTKSVGRRTLHMSVCMTASQYYALATSPLGEPIAQVVRYGPCGTHGIVFRPSLDVVRSRFAKNTLAAPNARRGRARGWYSIRSSESCAAQKLRPGIVTGLRVVPHEPSELPG